MAVPEPTPEDIKASFGFVSLLADAVPEIASLLQQAVGGQWTPDRFVMSVANTNWWKFNGAGARDWFIKQTTDPGTATREREEGARALATQLEQLGIPYTLDFNKLGALWVRSKIEQVTPDSMASFLFAAANDGVVSDKDMLAAGGRLGTTVNEMFKMANDFGYQTGDLTGEVLAEARKMMVGGLAGGTEAWKSKMINYAQSYYAPYADDIRGGKTVAEVAKPIMDRVASLLETTPDAINFSDPLVKKAMTEWNSSNGTARAYTLREIEDMTRKDTRWATTDNAMESAVNLVGDIGRRMGFLPGGGS